MTVVHNAHLARPLARDIRTPRSAIEMGTADPLRPSTPASEAAASVTVDTMPGGGVRRHHAGEAHSGAADAVAAWARRDVHVLLVGPRAAHYDVDAEMPAWG